MIWPRRIYVATANAGVYYTENFEDPLWQPTWKAVNDGLPDLHIAEFHIDPSNDGDIVYAMLRDTHDIYKMVMRRGWELCRPGRIGDQNTDMVHGFNVTHLGELEYTYGASGVVTSGNYYHSRGWDTNWPIYPEIQYCGMNPNCSCCGYCNEGGPTIWTYGCGSPRNGKFSFAWGMGAFCRINNVMATHCDCSFCNILHEGCGGTNGCMDLGNCHDQQYFAGLGVGAGTAPICYNPYLGEGGTWYTHWLISAGGDWRMLYFIDGNAVEVDAGHDLHFGGGYDSMWFDPNDGLHQKLLAGESCIRETFDAWSTWTSGSTLSTPASGIALYAGEDPDQVILGTSGHAVSTLYGLDDHHPRGIAGSQINTAPYLGSIPSTAVIGGIAVGGLGPLKQEKGGLRVYGVGMPYYSGDSRGYPMDGDRGAWDVVNYREKHAKDISDNKFLHHVPRPTNAEDFVYSEDGESWSTVKIPLKDIGLVTRETILTFAGELIPSLNPYRIYNKFGTRQTIDRVYLAVQGPPQGQSLIVDIHKQTSPFGDGSSVYGAWQSDRPQVSSGSYYGESVYVWSWEVDEFITARIDQVGNIYPGANLVVHILHKQSAYTATTFQHAMIVTEPYTTQHAMIVGPNYTNQAAYIEGV